MRSAPHKPRPENANQPNVGVLGRTDGSWGHPYEAKKDIAPIITLCNVRNGPVIINRFVTQRFPQGVRLIRKGAKQAHATLDWCYASWTLRVASTWAWSASNESPPYFLRNASASVQATVASATVEAAGTLVISLRS